MENQAKEQYTAPEMKLVGRATDVVRGTPGLGPDMWGEALPPQMEFADDEAE